MSTSPAPLQRVLVAYGSESGTALDLARRVAADPVVAAHGPQLLAFNELDIATLGAGDVLLAVSSSFGDGEPPANAERFHDALREAPPLPGLRYAVFGIGDTGYPRFCGFSKALDGLLSERRARPIMHRVDADAGYEAAFQRWLPVLGQVIDGDEAAGQSLRLQVSAYGADNAFRAHVVERRQLNASDPAAWHLRLDLRGSGMAFQAGDTLHVVPRNDPGLLQAIAHWYGDSSAAAALQDRELRILGRPLLRELARLGGSEALKQMLKISQRAALDRHLQGCDLLDVLQDHGSPQTVPLPALLTLLPRCLPRAYSIASHGDQDTVELCVREVRYRHRGRERRGAASRWLLQDDEPLQVYCRSHADFRLPAEPATPLLMVGTGTGIAPLRGLLQAMEAGGRPGDAHLLFGERHRAADFLYRDEMERWLDNGTLRGLATAFSRDGTHKRYVQHVLREHPAHYASLFARGAHLYLCGSRANLEQPLRGIIDELASREGGWTGLQASGRLHCELY